MEMIEEQNKVRGEQSTAVVRLLIVVLIVVHELNCLKPRSYY